MRDRFGKVNVVQRLQGRVQNREPAKQVRRHRGETLKTKERV
jgi:hypothetical protein